MSEEEEFNIEDYRTRLEQLKADTELLKELQDTVAKDHKEIARMEALVFKGMETGTTLDVEEFIFKTSKGRRNLYPPTGFEEAFMVEVQGYDKFIYSQTTYKPYKLTTVLEILDARGYEEGNHDRERILNLLGYKESPRTEKVTPKPTDV